MKNVCAYGLSLAVAAGLSFSVNAGELSALGNDGFDVDQGQIAMPENQGVREIEVSADSGMIRIDPADAAMDLRALQVPVWSEVVEVGDAEWVRLRFRDVVLAKSTEQVRESYIRVTSLEDGYEQYLDTESLVEWGNTTAYFNGTSVLVELMASPNVSNQYSRVQVVGVQASEPVSTEANFGFLCI